MQRAEAANRAAPAAGAWNADLPDAGELWPRITALFEEQGLEAGRQKLIPLLQDCLTTGRAAIDSEIEAVPFAGRAAASAYAGLTDLIVRTALDVASQILHPLQNPTTSERISVLAVGGYGRAEMAPFSDVDLLFLTPYKQTPWGESVIESTLYILWDLRLKVGQSVRTVEDCLRLGREDITIRTTLLEHRFLWGDTGLAGELHDRLWPELFKKTASEFVEAKIEERRIRHSRHGGSRYLVEPNVKESKGGLRDLQTLYWIQKYVYQAETTADLVALGLFTEDEAEIFAAAENFLWSVRAHLHLVTNRATEQMTFDTQMEIAARMGFEDSAGRRGVERFMQVYFLHARQVGELSRIFLVALEKEHIRTAPSLGQSILETFGFGRDTTPDGFKLLHGRLAVENPQDFLRDPVNILRLFRVGLDQDILIHPDALRMAAGNLDLITDEVRHSQIANDVFMDLMIGTKNPERALRRMNETGVLGAFVPEFRRIVAMMQFNMYHHYTVDEHTITCIGILAKVERGELDDELPVSAAILKKGLNRRVLYTALLLHDIGKGLPEDHSIVGADIARIVTPRLGLPPEEAETVVWLVRNHLLMSDVAQKRDLADQRTVADFAKQVQSVERLKLLMVLTACDIMGVGPGTWNNWKAALLRELYRRTRQVLRGGFEVQTRQDLVEDAQNALSEVLKDWSEADRQAEIDRHYNGYWLGTDLNAQIRVANMFRGYVSGEIKLDLDEDPDRDATFVGFAMDDHPGIFSRLAGALALAGANVVDARTFTTKDGLVASLYWVQDQDGHPYEPSRIDRLRNTIERILSGKVVTREALAPKDKIKKRERDFVVPTTVTFDNDGSDIYTIIEVETRDRPGLLYDLTRALAVTNVNIFAAIIATYGEEAVDVFYVKDLFGLKLHSENKRRSIESAIRDAVMKSKPDEGAA